MPAVSGRRTSVGANTPSTSLPVALTVHASAAAPRERMTNCPVDSATRSSITGASPSSTTSGATKRTSSTATRVVSVRTAAALNAASR
ncbi:hypothetical protein CJ468_05890 [Nocardia farcinica]|nr:hypothetical protein CJ468_05890 [Nocardia farcinica]SLJ01530.1 Uncharacterised protein [Mycobacteroides abscessus subsp. abscessus]